MEMKNVLATWSNICPGCNIRHKYPDSFIGKKVERITGKKVVSRIMPMLRFTAVTKPHRAKARIPLTTFELMKVVFLCYFISIDP